MAEKAEALTSLGIANSRMKDYFDLWVLAQHAEFDGDILRQAIRETFDRRRTTLPKQSPLGLTQVFAQDPQKQAQWQAFLRKNRLAGALVGSLVHWIGDGLSDGGVPRWVHSWRRGVTGGIVGPPLLSQYTVQTNLRPRHL